VFCRDSTEPSKSIRLRCKRKIVAANTPSDLPVEQRTKFEFIINLNAGKQIGLTIPPNVLVRADRGIK